MFGFSEKGCLLIMHSNNCSGVERIWEDHLGADCWQRKRQEGTGSWGPTIFTQDGFLPSWKPRLHLFFLQVSKMQQEKEQAVEDLQVNKDIDLFRKKIGAAGHLCAFSLITVDFLCRMWRRPLQTFTENMSEPSRLRGLEIFLGLRFITILRW